MKARAAIEDHRSRVATERRTRMHRKLVESALLVFAEKGVDASVIDDVITAAGVSRGTFYNYFRTNPELLLAANEELGNELATLIESRVRGQVSPAARIATGIRLYFNVAQRFPLFARFLAQAGPRAAGPSNLLYTYLPVHIKEGIKCGQFAKTTSVFAALDLIVGGGVLVVARLSAGPTDDDYIRGCVLGLMLSLGLSHKHAHDLVSAPLLAIEPDEQSLLVQSHKRYLEQKRRARAEARKLKSIGD